MLIQYKEILFCPTIDQCINNVYGSIHSLSIESIISAEEIEQCHSMH